MTNLGPALKWRPQPPPGQYQVRLSLWRDLGQLVAESAPFALTLVNPPEEQMRPIRAKAEIDDWGIHKTTGTLGPADAAAIADEQLRGLMAFTLLMNAAQSATMPADVPIADYEKMIQPYLLPEVRMLELRCLLAAGDKDKAERLKSSLVEKHPEMRTRVKLAENGQTFFLLGDSLKQPAHGR